MFVCVCVVFGGVVACLFVEDHVSVVALLQILSQDTHECQHGKTSVGDFPVLEVHPSCIGVIDPVAGSEQITWLGTWAFLNLGRQVFNGTTANDELNPGNWSKLRGSLQRIIGQLAVKGRVDTTGVQVPAQAGSHGNTAVLDFRLTVVEHGLFVLVGGQAEGIEEADGRSDANVPP